MDKEKVVKFIRKVLIVLIVIWMIGVFIFSNQSGEGSSGLSSKVALFIFKDESVATNMEPFIRKLAHMSEYAIGAMLFLGFCMTYPKMEPKKRYLFSELCIILYAATDEFHQLFISGRNGSIVDVLIDAAGGLVGMLILWFTTKLILGMEYKAQEDLERSGKRY
jgi:VanZ family protein